MTSPLPFLPQTAHRGFSSRGHAGLWYNKFLPWQIAPNGAPSREDGDNEKQEWITTVCGGRRRLPLGDQTLLEEYVARRERMLAVQGGQAICIKSLSRFVTGLGYDHPVENGFAWHHTLGTPYLPGAGLKGTARSWAELDGKKDADIVRIFGPRKKGSSANAGTVVFVEAIPRQTVYVVMDVMTPHYSPYYQSKDAVVPPGDYHDPNPIPFLVVEKDTRLVAGVMPRASTDRDDVAVAIEWLMEALREIGAGAKTAVGYGRFVRDDVGEAAWKKVESEVLRQSATPEEKAIEAARKMSEGALYNRAIAALDKEEFAGPKERLAFFQAVQQTRFFASWRLGSAVNPRECPAGSKKLKALVQRILGEAQGRQALPGS